MFNKIKNLFNSKSPAASKKALPKNKLQVTAMIIEETLSSFGIMARMVEVNILKDEIQFCLETPIGISLDRVIKHGKDIAMAIASPSGKVVMQAPIPGRALIGILVPKDPKYLNE